MYVHLFTGIRQARSFDVVSHLRQKSSHTEELIVTRLIVAPACVRDVARGQWSLWFPGGRSSVINSVASRTRTSCWAHINEWGSSMPRANTETASISTDSGSHSFSLKGGSNTSTRTCCSCDAFQDSEGFEVWQTVRRWGWLQFLTRTHAPFQDFVTFQSP